MAAAIARGASLLDVDYELSTYATGGDCDGARAGEGEPPVTDRGEEDGA